MSMQSHSSYWMDEEIFHDVEQDTPQEETRVNLNRIIRLAAARRAVANFVNILTNRNDIAVRYSSGKESYTDGKQIVISADDDPKNFDVMVGLALHEASHVLLTDFSFLTNLMHHRETIVNSLTNMERAYETINLHGTSATDYHYTNAYPTHLDAYFSKGGVMLADLMKHEQHDDPHMYASVFYRMVHPAIREFLKPIMNRQHDPANVTSLRYMQAPKYYKTVLRMIDDLKIIMNILEDRRIDKWVYQNAAGYRPYYNALYNKYFFTTEMRKNLKWNPEWRELTIENYINRVLYSIHPDSDPDALPGLRDILRQVDLSDIDRVGSEWKTRKVFLVQMLYEDSPMLWQEACMIYAQILRATGRAELEKEQPQLPGGEGDISPEMLEQILEGMSGTGLPNLDMGGTAIPREVDAADTTKTGKQKPRTFNGKVGKRDVQKMKDLTEGHIKKKKVKKAEKLAIDAIESSQAEMVDISGDGVPKVRCLVTRKLTDSVMDQDWFPFAQRWRSEISSKRRELAITAGKRMGAILLQKLQVRNDPMVTKYSRLEHGGLDRRLLAQLGMDIQSVFYKTRVDSYRPALLHLTLDASGSMYGDKWEQVVTVAVALGIVGKKMRNVETVISIRGGDSTPIVSIVYDSRTDQLPYLYKWLRILEATGSTPEGLCFRAVEDLVLENAATHDVYFINFSDGEPAFYISTKGASLNEVNVSYTGTFAIEHTRQQVQRMKDAGVKVLSYFIQEGNWGSSSKANFRRMYGDTAQMINVKNVTEVLRTLNKCLTAKG